MGTAAGQGAGERLARPAVASPPSHLMFEVLEPVGDARQVQDVTVAALFLQRRPAGRLDGARHALSRRLAPPRELVHRLLVGHAVHEPRTEGFARTLLEGLAQRVGRRAHPDHLVELVLPLVLWRLCEPQPLWPRRQVGIRQRPVRVVGQRNVRKRAAGRVREGEWRRAAALIQRAGLVAAVHRDVDVWLRRVARKHL